MKKIATRAIASLAIVSAVGVGIPAASAFADSGTTTTTSATTTTTTPTAWKTFHAAWVAYIDGLKQIRLTYRTSVASDKINYRTAVAAATSKAERQAARATLRANLANDLQVKVAAITAAGDPPSPPAGYNGTAFVQGLQAANVAYRASVTQAQGVYAQALLGATTSLERQAARLNLKAAVANALVVRVNALAALGTPPTHPGKTS